MKKSRVTWLSLASWCIMLAISGCGGRTAVPTSYSTYTDELNVFTIDYPDGWSCEGGSRKDSSWVKFASGNAQIEVDSDLAAKVLLSQIAVTGQIPWNTPMTSDPGSAARKAHWLETKQFTEEKGVKEEKPVTAHMKLGDGSKSEYTGTSAFGSEFHGYRATGMVDKKRIRILCQCPADEWESMKPAFDTVISSLEIKAK